MVSSRLSKPVTLSIIKGCSFAVSNRCPELNDSVYKKVAGSSRRCSLLTGSSDSPHVSRTAPNADVWLLQSLPTPTTSLSLLPFLPWQTIWPENGVVVGVVVALVDVGVVVVSMHVPQSTGHSPRSMTPIWPCWRQSSSLVGHTSGSSALLHRPRVVVVAVIFVVVVVVVVQASHRAGHMSTRAAPKIGCTQS